MRKIDEALQQQLQATLEAGFTDEAKAALQKTVSALVCDIEEDVMWRLKDELAHNLTAWVADMAEHAVTEIIQGNEDQMRRYLSCEKRGGDGDYIGWTGRSDGASWSRRGEPEEWHPVIHGKLFETGAIALRKKIASALPEVVASERIRDMEDQIKSLVAQLNKAVAERDAARERLREYA